MFEKVFKITTKYGIKNLNKAIKSKDRIVATHDIRDYLADKEFIKQFMENKNEESK